MTAFRNTSEGGTLAAGVTTGNSGGASGDAYKYVGINGSGATIVFDGTHPAHGTKSLKFTPVSGSTEQVQFGGSGVDSLASTIPAVCAYYYFTALPTDATGIMFFYDEVGTRRASVHIDGTGKLYVRDSGSTALWTAASALPTAAQIRVEMRIKVLTATTGEIYFAYYLGDSTTAVGTFTVTSANLGTGNIGSIPIGKLSNSTYATAFWVDDFAVETAATAFIGPANTAPVLSIPASISAAGSATATLNISVTDDGSIASYTTTIASAKSTASPSLTGASTNTVTLSAAGGNLVVLDVTVTDDGGLTDTDETEVRFTLAGNATAVPLALPMAGSSGTWNRVGSATSDGAALADASDATYLESGALSATEQWTEFRWQPTASRASGMMPLRLGTDTGTGNAIVRLVEGTTVRQTWNQAVTSTATDYNFTLDSATVSAVGDWGNLRARVGFTS